MFTLKTPAKTILLRCCSTPYHCCLPQIKLVALFCAKKLLFTRPQVHSRFPSSKTLPLCKAPPLQPLALLARWLPWSICSWRCIRQVCNVSSDSAAHGLERCLSMPRVSPATAGGHFNPAVSCAVFFSARDNSFTGRKAALYSVVQVLSGSWCGRVACNVILPSFVQHSLRTFRSWSWIYCKLLKLQQDSARCLFRTWFVVKNQASLQLSLQLVYLASQCQPSDRKLDISSLRRGEWTWVTVVFDGSHSSVFFFFRQGASGRVDFHLHIVLRGFVRGCLVHHQGRFLSCIWQDAWRSIVKPPEIASKCDWFWAMGVPLYTDMTLKKNWLHIKREGCIFIRGSRFVNGQSPGKSLLRTCNRLLCCCWWLRYGQCFWRIFESSSASEQKWEGKSVCCTGHCMAIINQTSCWKCVILIVLTVLAIFD